jgi:lipopolysaccharide cholinephosphotransferase
MNTPTHSMPESFFEEEVRCGYTVTAQMKKLWAVELDLLAKFAEVCERNGLSYFMDGGTLLGAIRHRGFIPWDDDVDVIMPREDYDKLWEIAEREFTHPYFFQTSLSEPGPFYRTHAQLRNSDTTGFIVEDSWKPSVNCGVFLDIFALDNIPDHTLQRQLWRHELNRKKEHMHLAVNQRYELHGWERVRYWFWKKLYFKVFSFKRYFDKFNRQSLGRWRNKDTYLVGDVTLPWRGNVQWRRAWYDGYVYLPFEDLKLRAPLFYHEVMALQYGDHMRMPEDVSAMNGREHGGVTFDGDTPYRAYFAQHREEYPWRTDV